MRGAEGAAAWPDELLVHFVNEEMLPGLAQAEFAALVELACGVRCRFQADDRAPFVRVRGVPSQAVVEAVCARAMLTQQVLHAYGAGSSYEELERTLDVGALRAVLVDVPEQKLKVQFDSFGHSVAQKTRVESIHRVLRNLPWKVQVDLKRPTVTCLLLEQWFYPHDDGTLSNYLHRVFFARQLACRTHTLQSDYQLNKRVLLSTTAMESRLAFIMANLAMVAPATLVCDPFVGSGSVLVACAHHGGYGVGMDYDARNFYGPLPGQTLQANFAQYGTQARCIGVVRADFSQAWMKRRPVFEAIVTDPPYGVREGVRRVGYRPNYNPDERPPVPAEADPNARVPMRQVYPYDELLADLLHFAADTLVDEGRLVFWHATDPATPVEDFDAAVSLPHLPCMELLCVGLQKCSSVTRRLVAYRRLPRVAHSEH